MTPMQSRRCYNASTPRTTKHHCQQIQLPLSKNRLTLHLRQLVSASSRQKPSGQASPQSLCRSRGSRRTHALPHPNLCPSGQNPKPTFERTGRAEPQKLRIREMERFLLHRLREGSLRCRTSRRFWRQHLQYRGPDCSGLLESASFETIFHPDDGDKRRLW